MRQLEVLRLIALGKTNKEIAGDLFLSPRTVDMHVGNIFTRRQSLAHGCRPQGGRARSARGQRPVSSSGQALFLTCRKAAPKISRPHIRFGPASEHTLLGYPPGANIRSSTYKLRYL